MNYKMSSERSLFSVLNGIRRLIAKKESAYSDNNFKQYWMPDSACKECYDCGAKFTVIKRKHHCRICGQVFCGLCTSQYVNGQFIGYNGDLRCCDYCVKVVKQCVVEEDFKLLNLYSTSSNNEQTPLMAETMENENFENSQILNTSLFDVKCNNSESDATSNFDNITDEVDDKVEKRNEDVTEEHTEIFNALEGLPNDQLIKKSQADQCKDKQHGGIKTTFESISSKNNVNSNLNQSNTGFHASSSSSSTSSLPGINKEDFTLHDYVPNKGASTFNELKQVYRDHLKKVINQLISKEKLDGKIWQDVIMGVCKTVCEKIDVKLNNSMDVRKYIKIKKVLEDGNSDTEDNRGEWLVIDGLAMSKTLTNKHMVAYMHALMEQRAFNQMSCISILLVDTPLQYQRLEGKISSFEPQILQEKTYLENLTQRLMALQPDIVVSSKNVAWMVQEQLKRHNVALIVNVKKENLIRLNRLVGGSIINSVDGMLSGTELGKCHDITFNHFTFKKRSKTLMFIKGLEPGHYTSVIIKGRSLKELIKVKRCIKFVIYAFHHLKSELSLLSTLSACIPSYVLSNYHHLSNNLDCSGDDNAYTDKKDKIRSGTVNEDVKKSIENTLVEAASDAIVSISPFFYSYISKNDKNGDRVSRNDLDTTPNYNHDSSMESLGEFVSEEEDDEEDDSCFNDDNKDSKGEHNFDVDKEPISDLFKHNFVAPFSHNIVFKNMLSEYRAQGCRGVYKEPTVVSLEDYDNINNHYNKEVDYFANNEKNGFKILNGGIFTNKNDELISEKAREDAHIQNEKNKKEFNENNDDDNKKIDCIIHSSFEQNNHCQVNNGYKSLNNVTKHSDKINNDHIFNGKKQKSKKQKNYFFDITKHQGISILFYSFSEQSANFPSPCVNPWIVTMDFYSSSDIALGVFLHRYCFNNSYKCVNSRCDSSMLTHIRRFVKGSGCVEVSLCKDQPPIDYPSLPSNYTSVSTKSPNHNHNIFVWTCCDVCNKSSKKFLMGKEVYHISLGKYLEMRLNECIYQSIVDKDDTNDQVKNKIQPSSQLQQTNQLDNGNKTENQRVNKQIIPSVNDTDKIIPTDPSASTYLKHSQTATSFNHRLSAEHQVLQAPNGQLNDKPNNKLGDSLENLTNLVSSLPYSDCYHSINHDQTHIFQCKSTQVAFKQKKVEIYSIEYPSTNIPPSTYPCQVLIEDAVLLRNRLEELFEKITEVITRVCKDSLDATYSSQLKTDKGSLMEVVVLMEDTIGELQDAEHNEERKLLYEEVMKLQLKIRKTITNIVKIWNEKLNATELKKSKTNVSLLKNQHSIPEDNPCEIPGNEDKDLLIQTSSAQQSDNQTQNKIFTIGTDNNVTQDLSQLSSSLPEQQLENLDQHPLSSSQPSSSSLIPTPQSMPQHELSISPPLSEQSQPIQQPLQVSPDVTEDVFLNLDSDSKPKSKVTESFSETTAKVKQMITNFLLPSSNVAIQDPNPADEHNCLEGVDDIVIHETELSSIIAFALSTQQYKEKLAETCKNTNFNTYSMPSFQEKQSLSFIKSKTSKAHKRQPTMKASSSPIKATSSSSSSVGYTDENFENVDSVKYTPNEADELDEDEEIEAEISIPKELKQKQSKANNQNEHIEISFSDTSTKFTCKIYYAYKFSQLRSIIVGEEKGFIHSLSRSRSWKGGGGKSGSNFNKTRDNRFFLKQMSAREVQSFTEFAPMYIQHINQCYANQMTSTLAKIVGVYRIEIDKLNNVKAPASVCEELLVIENLFCNHSLNQIYDLKGSTRNRLADTRVGRYNNVLLDENLIKNMMDQPWYTKERSKEKFMASLQRDTLFLCKHSVMDYSLLVGVDDTSGRLVVGIIDYIRTFTWDKKMEMLFKTTYAKKMPTVQDPEAYKTRFIDSMKKYFMDVPSHQPTRHYL